MSRRSEDVPLRERPACLRLSGRIADHAGKIADEENDLMSQFLELAQLLDEHGMADMYIRRCRSKPA